MFYVQKGIFSRSYDVSSWRREMSPGVQFVTEEDIKYIPAEWARSGGGKL